MLVNSFWRDKQILNGKLHPLCLWVQTCYWCIYIRWSFGRIHSRCHQGNSNRHGIWHGPDDDWTLTLPRLHQLRTNGQPSYRLSHLVIDKTPSQIDTRYGMEIIWTVVIWAKDEQIFISLGWGVRGGGGGLGRLGDWSCINWLFEYVGFIWFSSIRCELMPTFWWRSLYRFGFHPFWNFIVSPLFTQVWVAAFGWKHNDVMSWRRLSSYDDVMAWKRPQIEAETRCQPFCRRHLQIHFLEWKLLYLDLNFTEVCS